MVDMQAITAAMDTMAAGTGTVDMGMVGTDTAADITAGIIMAIAITTAVIIPTPISVSTTVADMLTGRTTPPMQLTATARFTVIGTSFLRITFRVLTALATATATDPTADRSIFTASDFAASAFFPSLMGRCMATSQPRTQHAEQR